MSLRFDWYPECNHELINTRTNFIIDNISKRNIKKGNEAGGKVTRVWAVGELLLAFDGIGLIWFPQRLNPRESLVFLRDLENPNAKSARARKRKIDLPVPETPEVVTYRDNLYHYNEFLLRHCVALNLDDQNLNLLAVEMSNRTEEDSENWFSEEVFDVSAYGTN